MVRIGFDIRPLLFTRAGIRTYLYNLVVNIAKRCDCQLKLFGSSASHVQWEKVSPNLEEEVVRLPQLNSLCESFWQEVLLPRALKRNAIDVFHGVRFFLPQNLSCPGTVTIHDLAFKKLPRLVSRKTARYFDALTVNSLKVAQGIITPSQTTKSDLVDLYSVKDEKIQVVYEAADPGFNRITDQERISQLKEKFKIKKRFILSVGTIEPRKNISGLLEAFNNFKGKDDFELVISGGFGWLYSDVLKKLKQLGLENRVIFTGHVSQEELSLLYSSCEASVFASFYEGFGLPVLEAMQCGACVIASNTSSLKELFSGAFEPIDPYRVDSISFAIERITSDNNLRSGLQIQGKEKAKTFSWEIAADKTMDIYRKTLARL